MKYFSVVKMKRFIETIIKAAAKKKGASVKVKVIKNMNKGMHWLPSEIELLINSRDPDDIARITGRSRAAVMCKMTRLNVKSTTKRGRKRKYTDEQRAEMVRLYIDGKSQTAIAKIMGCSQLTVSNVVTEYFKRG